MNRSKIQRKMFNLPQSPHAAYSQGYLDGVNKYYKEKND